MVNDEWPHCLPTGSAIRAALTHPVDWAAACARTQARHGCDIGSAGRLIVEARRGVAVPPPQEAQEGGADAFGSDGARDGGRVVSGDPERFHEVAWEVEV